MALSMSPASLPARWSSLGKEVGITEEQPTMSGATSPDSDGYYDSGEERVAVAPNMAVITRAIRQKKSRMYLDERYMSSEEALSLSPPGEELQLTDDGEDTYDVDDLLEDIFEGEEKTIYQTAQKRSFVDLAVALSITPIGRARMIAIESPTSSSSFEREQEEEVLRRMSKASKRDVPFIAVPKRLRPLSIVKPIEILDDGSQSAASPDFWTAVPMFGNAIIPPRSDSIPSVSRTASDSSASRSPNASSPSITDASSQFSQTESNTTAPDSPPMERRPSTTSLFQKDSTAASKGPSLFKSLGSKITTLARKPKIDSLADASNGLAANTMSTGTAAPAFTRTNSISHRRRESIGRLAGRTFSAFSTTNVAVGGEKVAGARPKMEARGASERAPMLELPPFPDEMEFRVEADAEVMAISKQLTRRPVGGRTAHQLQKEERETKRRSLLGLGRRSNESSRGLI